MNITLTFDGRPAVAQLRVAQVLRPKEDVRYYLNGILFDFDKDCIVATDGRRLYKADLAQETDYQGQYIVNIEGTIPMSVERAVLQIGEDGKTGNLELFREKDIDGWPFKVLPARVIDGTYPDWERVLGEDGESDAKAVAFNPTLLADIVMAAGAKDRGVKLSWGSGGSTEVLRVEIPGAMDEGTVIRLMPMDL